MSDSPAKFDSVIEALQDVDHPFPARLLRSFSDLSNRELRNLQQIWSGIHEQRKIALFEDLELIAESDTLVCFDEFAKLGLSDPSSAVRVLAVRLLWECDDTKLIAAFIEMMLSDPAVDARAAAASALGRFVYLAELDTISDELGISIVQNLLDVVTGEELPLVQRSALESLGYSSHPKVPALILKALESEETPWLCSALYAIGRSADDKWSEVVLKFLNHSESEVQFEAIRAAGELGLDDARDDLLERLDETEDDLEMRYAIIWSLSQIGGEGIKEKFVEMSEKSTGDEELGWLEKGLENLEAGGDLDKMELIDIADEADLLDEDGEDIDFEEEIDGDSEENDEY